MRIQARSPASLSGLRIWHCCKLWYRFQKQPGSNVAVAVLQAPAAATIRPLALELLYAAGITIKSERKRKKGIIVGNSCHMGLPFDIWGIPHYPSLLKKQQLPDIISASQAF